MVADGGIDFGGSSQPRQPLVGGAEEHIRDASDYAGFKNVLETLRGFVRAAWCGDEACEDRIKTETMATIRVIPLEDGEARSQAACVYCGRPGKAVAYFARAY